MRFTDYQFKRVDEQGLFCKVSSPKALVKSVLRLEAITFDAYGTLLDLNLLNPPLNNRDPGVKSRFLALWRSKQLEYMWLRTLMKNYANFEVVSGDALKYAIRSMGVEESNSGNLMKEFRVVGCFPDVIPTLRNLKQKGIRMVILSNGTKTLLNSALKANGLNGYFEEVLSVNQVKAYKPDWIVYELARKYFDFQPKNILFVSSNSWDVVGGGRFGFRTAWCNRSNSFFDELGYSPDWEISELGGLTRIVDGGRSAATRKRKQPAT